MPTLKNMNDLEKYLKSKIKKALQNEVFEEVRDVEQKNIDRTVYDSYKPKVYNRRDIQDGLIADSSISGNMVSDEVLEVKNIAKPSPPLFEDIHHTEFPEWVERGYVKNWWTNEEEVWENPRPFTQNTIDDLERNKQHVKAMKDGLKKQGLDVK